MTSFLFWASVGSLPNDNEKLPDIHGGFSYQFPYSSIAEEVDKSVEPKAWIGYDESISQRPFYRVDLDERKASMASSFFGEQFMDRHTVLKLVVDQHASAWISVETARSILYDYYAEPFGAGGHGSCGQYKYIRTNSLIIPTSENDFAVLSIVMPLDGPSCYTGIETPFPSISTQGSSYVDKINTSWIFLSYNLDTIGMVWIVLAGAVIWRGVVARTWIAQGLGYRHFELMVKMRGSMTRLEILESLSLPKTRQMISHEINKDWKAVDRHIQVLLKNDLVKEVCNVSRETYYVRSEQGDKLMNLMRNIHSSGCESNSNGRMLEVSLFTVI